MKRTASEDLSRRSGRTGETSGSPPKKAFPFVASEIRVGTVGGKSSALASCGDAGPEVFPVEGLSMSFADAPSPAEVDCLLRNAELRDATEPFFDDDTHGDIDFGGMPTEIENRYLESMLAWEHAPLTPVAHWFSPTLVLSPAVGLTEIQLRERLWSVIDRLYGERIVLDFTDHLTDRELYNLIRREILPTPIKRVDLPDNYFHWDCSAIGETPDLVVGQWYPEPVLDSLIWLTFYADDAERAEWEADFGVDLPPREVPPYPRALPSAPV